MGEAYLANAVKSSKSATGGTNSDFVPVTPMYMAPDPNSYYASTFMPMTDSYTTVTAQQFQPQLQPMQDLVSFLPGDDQEPGLESFVPDNMLEMWSATPSGFEWNDWDSYMSNLCSARTFKRTSHFTVHLLMGCGASSPSIPPFTDHMQPDLFL
ncbi:uncharacterized protein LAESUDRAFT_88357 [Laetiporus sulphureus 93-53]|uniref:Uncharacterized protein n=1 Tax=Laetiporus sulphureus 93-53 TaxID=1314785 RepID=A0A165EX69_9APHY|nr:uncharacterized protein LAESUDRAFT_88357 [Laetiporus sulphureus 93-53]KZT07916.1 hypothetical protein LAESUDRAFT_88357 [Laetiporus sulphureus 93-53]